MSLKPGDTVAIMCFWPDFEGADLCNHLECNEAGIKAIPLDCPDAGWIRFCPEGEVAPWTSSALRQAFEDLLTAVHAGPNDYAISRCLRTHLAWEPTADRLDAALAAVAAAREADDK